MSMSHFEVLYASETDNEKKDIEPLTGAQLLRAAHNAYIDGHIDFFELVEFRRDVRQTVRERDLAIARQACTKKELAQTALHSIS